MKIFGGSLIRPSIVLGQLSIINVKKPHSMGDGIIPPLNPPNISVGLRFKIPYMKDMSGGGSICQ